MKRNKVTLNVLAKEVGLSISTISKSLKDSDEISEETKLLVIEAAKRLGYKGTVVNPKTNKIVAVVIPDVINDFFAQVLTGIEEVATQHNYKVITCLTNESLDKEVAYLDVLDDNSIDGIIIAAAKETQTSNQITHLQRVVDKNIPMVMFDRSIDDVECDKIVVDDVLSAARAVEFLVDRGDKHICMASSISQINVGQLREQGVRKAMESHEDVILNVITSTEEAQFEKRMEDALRYDGIDAVIALDQAAAIIALNKANELNIAIPQDLQIIGYSNGILSRYSYPKMTVIDQHARELGNKAFIRMRNLIDNEDDIKVTRIHTLKTSLLERGTTRK
ncbi:LacI family DNA-binding transcriptional regulator [Nonlabens ponticola]|uniref:LacI family transcriptional regulator n=1 Tax=Nonlabens ponticola TaxID=2496866 RepID=A0A3S9MZD0_9FLAO|nr:LacI family DNA-binding transcriptional regulator [Nonlabens ponticola]AZQ44452.1 LacI family transcriptional regulator [Nonlabens ponticola]